MDIPDSEFCNDVNISRGDESTVSVFALVGVRFRPCVGHWRGGGGTGGKGGTLASRDAIKYSSTLYMKKEGVGAYVCRS